MAIERCKLDGLYLKYNKRRFISPDPLQFLYIYENSRDREIVGLIASGLAYGRVKQILKSVSSVLERMGSPFEFVCSRSPSQLKKRFSDFKHRFTTGVELAELLIGIRRIIKKYGSLHRCFASNLSDLDATLHPAGVRFLEELSSGFDGRKNSMVPLPESKSANKRFNLFLRWMVRSDEVDPGGWYDVPSSKLMIPLDTHMHKISLGLGLTKRKQADLKTVMEVTDSFKRICPDDPVKYDFTLTRFGIRDDMNISEILHNE